MGVSNQQRSLAAYRSSLRYWHRRLLPLVELTPLRIALAYAVFGLSALYVSDVVFVRYLAEPLLSQAQALKGGLEVVLTAGLILVLTQRRETQLRRSMERLDRQREEIQVLHRVLRHNLRNDLNVIQGYVERLCDRTPAAERPIECDRVLDTVEKMARYTDLAARINRITERNGQVRTCDLREQLPRAIESHPAATDDVEITVSLPDDAVVEANPMVTVAFGELLSNAIEHNDAEAPAISIDVDPDAGPPHMVEIRVSDNGPGIPPSELEPLRAGEEDQLFHLSGLGLWFVKWTVRHSGGELFFESDDGDGTVAIVRVPKSPEMLSSTLWG